LAVTQIHDELLLYKQIYENLLVHIRENKAALVKYENVINVSLAPLIKGSAERKREAPDAGQASVI
jgi:hypothetical protein